MNTPPAMPISAEVYETLVAFRELRAPETFDRDRLKAMIVAARPRLLVDETVVEGVAGFVYAAWMELSSRRLIKSKSPSSKRLRNAYKALSGCVDNPERVRSPEGWLALLLLLGFEINKGMQLMAGMGFLIEQLEEESRKPPGKGEDPLTAFCVALYVLYSEVTGKKGLTDDGPAYRFVRDCAAIVDPRIVVPARGFRQRIQASIARAMSNHLQQLT
jgi:hypothetical protein